MRTALTALAAVSVLLAACDGPDGGAGGADTRTEAAQQTVATPPLSPFCEAVDRLEARLDESTVDDERSIIVEGYTEMLDLVPAELRADFEAVLDDLRAAPKATPPTSSVIASRDLDAPGRSSDAGGAGVTTQSAPSGTLDFEEGYTPSDDPAARVNAYVEFACDRSENNPGPPPTQPAPPPSSTLA